jgi:CheY-like chemotaxis protein
VITASDGPAAINIFSKHHDEIAVVLLDMMMPGMDGLETLDGLRVVDPDVIVVACSGLRTTQREMEVKERGAKAFLPKPYSEDQLLQTLSKALK